MTNQLKEIISKGYSFCCEFNSEQFNIKQKKTENYKQSQLIILDFDHSSISLDEVLSTIKIKPTIAFNTFSNTDTDHCFKLIYLFEVPIKSIEEHKLKSLMIVYLLFNQKELDIIKSSNDKSIFNPVQLCNGTNQRVELNVFPVSFSICSNCSGKVCPSNGLPSNAKAPTMTPVLVFAIPLLFPNS